MLREFTGIPETLVAIFVSSMAILLFLDYLELLNAVHSYQKSLETSLEALSLSEHVLRSIEIRDDGLPLYRFVSCERLTFCTDYLRCGDVVCGSPDGCVIVKRPMRTPLGKDILEVGVCGEH